MVARVGSSVTVRFAAATGGRHDGCEENCVGVELVGEKTAQAYTMSNGPSHSAIVKPAIRLTGKHRLDPVKAPEPIGALTTALETEKSLHWSFVFERRICCPGLHRVVNALLMRATACSCHAEKKHRNGRAS